MKTTHLFKSSILFAIIFATVLCFSSCKKKKGVVKMSEDLVEVKLPCKEFGNSDKKNYRADAQSSSQDMSLSREKALTLAKQRVAAVINTQIKSVTDRYVNEREFNEDSEFEQKFENLTREVVSQTLSDIEILCEKNFRDKNSGKYTTHIAIGVNKDNLLNNLSNKLSKDKKLQIDYDKMKFEQIFNEEMEKLDSEN